MIGLLWGVALSMQTQPYFPPAFTGRSFVCEVPAGLPGKFEIMSDFESQWYSEHLRAASEASLYAASLRPHPEWREAVRFTWLRSFHAPIVVRVELRPTGPHLIAKQLSGHGGYDPGVVNKSIDRALTRSEGAELALRKAAALAEPARDCALGTDGAVWIVEGVDAKGYRLVQRWTPDKGKVRAVGEYLIRLTGWQVGEIY